MACELFFIKEILSVIDISLHTRLGVRVIIGLTTFIAGQLRQKILQLPS
jgi:hypothetical protein